MNFPRVAVLLAAYNGRKWISEQLTSIIEQLNVTVNIFISVDLSDDGTYEWCLLQASIYSNIIVLDYGEQFGGAAKNFFRLIHDVDFSGYDYIALSDQDDIWLGNKLSRGVDTIRRNHLDAFSSDVVAFWEDGKEVLIKKSYPQKRFDYLFEAAGPGCTYIFTSQSLNQFKFFLNENWQEVNNVSLHDWMIYSYYRSHDMSWFIDNQALMRYRQHSDNQVGSNSGLRAAVKRLVLIKSKWYSEEVSKITKLLKSDVNPDLNRWFLIKNIFELRRRPRDVCVLLLMLVSGFF